MLAHPVSEESEEDPAVPPLTFTWHQPLKTTKKILLIFVSEFILRCRSMSKTKQFFCYKRHWLSFYTHSVFKKVEGCPISSKTSLLAHISSHHIYPPQIPMLSLSPPPLLSPVSFSSSSVTFSHSSLRPPSSSGERPAESGAADGEQRIGCNRRRAQRLSGRHGCWFGLTAQWQHGSRQWVPPSPHTRTHTLTCSNK